MPNYAYYQSIFAAEKMPFAYVDLDLFDQNIHQIAARAAKKRVRIASKSIRCVALMQRILASGEPYKGIMAYTAAEAVWLSQQGFDNILVAYPTYNPSDIQAICQELQKGKYIVLMIDNEQHITQINNIAKQIGVMALVCMDIDMSSDYLTLHFGVYRSNIRTTKQVQQLLGVLDKNIAVKLVGIMGYEAQIAGIGDTTSTNFIKNALIARLKERSTKELAKRRGEIMIFLYKNGYIVDFCNGGGTGSLETTTLERSVDEVTAGSGFYSPTLFDNYQNFKHLPAAGFALEITRQPKRHIYTCLGGGYVASGSAGPEKLPQPYLPQNCQLLPTEGAGEVQTPIIYKGKEKLTLGSPIFMRHAKAGELCEHFNELILVANGKIIDKVPTYRGMGKCFL